MSKTVFYLSHSVNQSPEYVADAFRIHLCFLHQTEQNTGLFIQMEETAKSQETSYEQVVLVKILRFKSLK